MQLSEAMRLGSLLHPQSVEGLVQLDTDKNIVASCALGAAGMAVGIDMCDSHHHAGADMRYVRLRTAFPVLVLRREMPGTRRDDNYWPMLEEVVWRLNDERKWSREEIAAWVEGVEASLAAAPVEKEAACAAQ